MSRRAVIRWGRSAYETDYALQLEREAAERLGLEWRLCPSLVPPDALERAGALVVTSGVRVDAGALRRFAGDLVITTTSGFDHVDLTAAEAGGIAVLRLPQARRDAVAEHALACLLHLSRRLGPQLEASRHGAWARGALPAMSPRSVRGSEVLVVGLGVIGRRVAALLQAMGAHVLGVDPGGVPTGVEEVALADGLRRCDAVTLHCDLNPSSEGLLHRGALALLRPHAIVVNTARGALLDVEEAVRAVTEGRLGGLAVDVFPSEPWPALAVDHPAVLFTPHAAGYTEELGARVAEGVEGALRAWVEGAPLPHRVR
ncbi:MAG: hydroxyacid dehydrogenase [Deltaproteobacteria bacterium]|nr:hydroxyacid dehydrogenase [Deltaproteobacteria bacterium]